MIISDFFKGFWREIKLFGEVIASLINFILLSAVYLIGVGITSILAKIFGKHFLEMKKDENANTYWKDLNLTKKKKEEYYRQF